MDKENLRKVQLVQLEMAKEVKRVCEELGIKYILDGGTLLGAVRHKGFIPWDDDLDIGMTRKNYERFISEAPAILSSKYTLQSWKTDAHYGLPFAKLRKNGTKFVEEASEGVNTHNGIYIDIFPYDAYPTSAADRKYQGIWCGILRRLALIKCGYSPWRAGKENAAKKIIYRISGIAVLFVSRETLMRKCDEVFTKFEKQNTEELFSGGTVNYGKWVVKRTYLEETAPLPFEDDKFLCPIEYDAFLTGTYGDYMIPPPENERENRHKIIKLSFGDEE